jgi:hypothetical protein
MANDKGNTAVPEHGDRDRVAMLSLRADGTPDQHNPEIIGDKEFALEATREQFRQQAVSAVDQAERKVADTGAEVLEQDPQIAALQQAHQDAEAKAEAAADATVETLFREPETAAQAAAASSTDTSTKTSKR